MNCRIGRVLRRLEVGEEMAQGDVYWNDLGGYSPVSLPWWGSRYDGSVYKPIYRPLTPEEVEEHKRKFNRCKCGRELNSMGYCPPCRQNSNVKYIERVRA